MGFGDTWSTFFRRMPWFLQYYILLLPLAMTMVSVVDSGRKLPAIYWNSTNSMFFTSSRANEIDINLGDSIDIICPRYPPGTSVSEMEYYVIYKVNETQYHSCTINNTSKFKMLINCSNPTADYETRYTLLIKRFQSIPGNPDFEPGNKYYFITTSGGGLNEVDNQYYGACHFKNMKIVLSVCCGNGTTTTKRPALGNSTGPSHTTTPRRTTRAPTTTTTTPTSTTVVTTPKAVQSTPWTSKSTNTDSNPGNGNPPDENIIHAGGGPKNVGVIIDSAGHRTILSGTVLVICVSLAHWIR